MTPFDLVEDLKRKWPARIAQLDGWLPQYQQLLGKVPSDVLAQAYMVLMTGWTKAVPPNPATISAALPMRPKVSSTTESSVSADTAAMKHRVDAANAWWSKHNHDTALFREYRHRCQHGIPTPEDLEAIAQRVESDKVFAERGREGVKMTVGEPVKPNWVPMPRKKPEAPAAGLKRDTGHIEENTQLSENTGQLDPPAPEINPYDQAIGEGMAGMVDGIDELANQAPGEPEEIPFD